MIGKILNPPEIEITGFESKRSDSPNIAAEVQERVIEMILLDEDFDAISDYVRSQISELREDFQPRKHALPSVLNKSPEEYPNRPVKRATIYSNEYLDYSWEKDTNPWLVYVSKTPPGLPKTDVIAIEWTDDVPDGFVINYDEMVRKGFQEPLEKILSIVGYRWSEIKTGKKTQSIGDSEAVSGNPMGKSKVETDEKGALEW